MTQYPLIGLIGKKRSGKDTFASTLIEELNYTKIAYADPLREAALALNPIVNTEPGYFGPVRYAAALEEFGYEGAKDKFPEFRAILQRLGTESIRALDDGFWLRIATARISATTGPVVVTDVRFPNEADRIHELGGRLVRIIRLSTEEADEHPSEKALDGYAADYDVQNDRSLDDLANVARAIAKRAQLDANLANAATD